MKYVSIGNRGSDYILFSDEGFWKTQLPDSDIRYLKFSPIAFPLFSHFRQNGLMLYIGEPKMNENLRKTFSVVRKSTFSEKTKLLSF